MFVAMNRISCPKDYAAHLEQAFAHAGNMQGVPGFLLFQFLKNNSEGERAEYLALTQWESQAAYESWARSESFQRTHQGAGDSSVSAVLETYTPVQ